MRQTGSLSLLAQSESSPDGIGEDETAFGVGIADLHGEPLARAVDVARAKGGAGNRVLDGRDDHAQVELDPARHEHMRERKHAGRAAHVLLHVEHAAFGLDVEAARIEAHALADERDLGMAHLAPGEIDEAGRAGGRAPDRVDKRKILFQQIVADDRAQLSPVALRESAGGCFEFGRAHVVRRRVDEIAGEADALEDAGEVLAVDVAGQFEPELLVVLLAVACESVGAERKGERRKLCIVREGGEAIGARGQECRQRAGPKQVLVGLLGTLERKEDASKTALGRGKEAVAARLRLEARGIHEGTRARIERLAQLAPSRRVNEGYRNRRHRLAAGEKNRVHWGPEPR
jgi:hypothetical protein